MTLLEYLHKTGVEQPLPRPVAELLSEERALDLGELLSDQRPTLRVVPLPELVAVLVGRHRWLAWRTRLKAVTHGRAERQGPALPTELADESLFPDEVDALARTADVGGEAGRALYTLYREATAIALESTAVTASLADKKHPRAPSYADAIGEWGPIHELEGETWLRLLRGAEDGVLKLQLELPMEAIEAAYEQHREALAELVAGRKPQDALREILLRDVEATVIARHRLRTEEALVAEAAERYTELLLAKPVTFHPVGAVFIGTDRQRVGQAVLDKRGAVTSTAPVRPAGDWVQRVCRWMKDQRVRMVVLPEEAQAAPWLEELSAALLESKARTLNVSVAGLIEARNLEDPVLRRVSPEEASAVVLARRAVRPLEEWCRVPPLRLGLVPRQAELDQERLREILELSRERAIASEQPLMVGPVGGPGIRQRSSEPLNPGVQGLRDLRPGLSLKGVVTNVTKFGAFINIGLRQEGLVHISELSDEYVNDPNEVVRPGQQVQARVISVDLERGRIALSMRTESAMPRPGGGPPGAAPPRRGPPRAGRGPATGVRARALHDLESLFKK